MEPQLSGETERIIIVGGGIGGLSAAFELSNTAVQRERYDLTVYQMGWRLGGKCATGRNPNRANRIEEHGIHGFLGSYFNALTLMQRVYDAWEPPADSPLSDFSKAFPTENSSFLWERDGQQLLRWHITRDVSHGSIGDANKFGTLLSWMQVLPGAVQKVAEADLVSQTTNPQEGVGKRAASEQMGARGLIDQFQAFDNALQTACSAPHTSSLEATQAVDWAPMSAHLATPTSRMAAPSTDRRQQLLFEFLQVMVRGIKDDNLLADGIRKIDREDFHSWLERHGASGALLQSPLIYATINTTYQYPDGDLAKAPRMSAASYLMWTFRSFVSLGAPYYLFAAGSGDTIVAPMFEVLRARGVKFRFFHKLTDIEIDGDAVSRVCFERQAKIKRAPYEPLRTVKNVKSWTNKPDLSLLKNGEDLADVDFEAPWQVSPHAKSIALKHGRDFDKIVLAIPPGAIGQSAPGLCKARPDWKNVTEMATVATQSAQVWFSKTIPELDENAGLFHLAGNFMTGLHGHVDFSKFIEFETWEPASNVQGLLYFSGVFPNETAPTDQNEENAYADQVRTNACTLLQSAGAVLLPNARMDLSQPAGIPHSLNFDLLVSAQPNGSGSKRFDDQYWRINCRPSERYTQAPPDTIRSRISPLNTGLKNMTAAGDWVDTVLNIGSFEGAVMGGMLAASAIDTTLPVSRIIGIAPTPTDSPV